MATSYDQEFFWALHHGAKRSAQEIVPVVLELFHPKNIVDVGCGDGTWLSVFKEHGIQSCLGIDGLATKIQLRISQEEILAWDLSIPLKLQKTFDLVVSLEVAEHLPTSAAKTFVETLTSLGPVILFSAAIPSQGGTDHLNEQWPDYWAALFQNYNYVAVDCLRDILWSNDKVEPWYAQNILCFIRQDRLKDFPKLHQQWLAQPSASLSRVHPKIYLSKLIYSQDYPIAETFLASNGKLLKVNHNRFGYLDLEITCVDFRPDSAIGLDQALHIDINYRTQQSIYGPIFCVYIVDAEDRVYYETNTQQLGIPIELVQGQGTISLAMESLPLKTGNYFIDIGIFERNWSYLYDYHWHVYPLQMVNSRKDL
ncbi:Wzt carbohydrate-binding domain-containing protein [Leptolyngbya cf. ectocarpi LEGE 11479]|uniref:Wzt carbohydrate-binding domain-containing protein n=1 Tax=Leptolyngbya cf. ectocarpi LEGE 11479 TaxID=1828722 RepID=A0A928X4K3_LEPEC|nr:methyltransferase domain-containing protein [Leptolyngbya ectocarpi]MBE9066473.1 Wzt carbohydrate-binding domain-containing protein [Leptolyngbya cf. ectocarpi LEGE 11479]